ncbi:hypothetical protein [Actinacidiphila glaucinigra]|uniref:hypothetical protein n=1 Tax=Actinacidiphila glaucinigra TaxID=235986 RepID=UPI003D89F12A
MNSTLVRRAAVTVMSTVAATSLLAAGSAEAGATAAPTAAPRFLAPKELPPYPNSPWYADRVKSGLPEGGTACTLRGLPRKGVSHRSFWTELDTNAQQVTFTTKNSKAARDLAAELRKSVRSCAARFLAQNPGSQADWKDFGGLAVEEGAHVYGVHVAPPESEHNVRLYGIGRDGRTVTVVEWGQMGTLDQIPLKAFKKTTRTAVNKLYR